MEFLLYILLRSERGLWLGALGGRRPRERWWCVCEGRCVVPACFGCLCRRRRSVLADPCLAGRDVARGAGGRVKSCGLVCAACEGSGTGDSCRPGPWPGVFAGALAFLQFMLENFFATYWLPASPACLSTPVHRGAFPEPMSDCPCCSRNFSSTGSLWTCVAVVITIPPLHSNFHSSHPHPHSGCQLEEPCVHSCPCLASWQARSTQPPPDPPPDPDFSLQATTMADHDGLFVWLFFIHSFIFLVGSACACARKSGSKRKRERRVP